MRREEDRRALGLLGAEVMHANFPDCIYRRDRRGKFVYRKISQILKQETAEELGMIDRISDYLRETIGSEQWDIVYSPLALGGHIDHRIVHEAVLNIIQELPAIIFHFYEDLPYVIEDSMDNRSTRKTAKNYLCFSVKNAAQKYKAMQAYQSQIKSANYPTGIDIDAIMQYGEQTGKKANRLGERVWYRKS